MELALALVEDDEDLVLLTILNPTQQKKKYYKLVKSQTPFDLDRLTDDFCWIHFRFLKADLVKLKNLLGIPDVVRCRKSVTVSGLEGLCILLKRLSYPGR